MNYCIAIVFQNSDWTLKAILSKFEFRCVKLTAVNMRYAPMERTASFLFCVCE